MSSINLTDSIASNAKPVTSNDDTLPYKTITYHGAGDEYVEIDGRKYLRHELMQAFGGTFNPGLAPYPKHQFANASALGLAGFSTTTFVLGLYYSGAMGITIPNVVVSMCIFYGGLVQTLAGVWELAIGNTFAGTVFTSYGTFWISFGAIFIKAFGIQAAYAEEPEQFGNAVGFFLIGWGLYTFMNILVVMKATLGFVSLLVTLDVAFFLLAAGNMNGNATVTKVGGIMATISACCGFWNMFAGISTPTNSYFTPPVFLIPQYEPGKKKANK
ncbi:GPR1/FUN34/yaaH family-domain-containing protein [Scheffersomyces xylosifermentans]|uniref:GPR1/FUN34/yaaH family-domain-containing protein n=1 Tax=Scheffersomyces xylosifermentans TaxID=1304137 RepID=UPI00315C9191